MRLGVLVLALMASGCGRSLTTDTAELPPAVNHHARFAGLWLVDQPSHALYEATYYALEADGRVKLVDSYGVGQPAPFDETGVVAPSQTSSLKCTFGGAWRSEGESVLIIRGRCTDGVERDIELLFTSPAAQNGVGAGSTVEIRRVGGESGWIHPGFEWRFKKCPPGPFMIGGCTG